MTITATKPPRERGKGVVMRRSSLLLVIVALALTVGLASCGGGGLSSMQQPEEMLQTILDASASMNSGTATVQADLQIRFDPNEVPPQDLVFAGIFSGPITVSGTIDFSGEETVDLDMTVGLAGMTYNMGFRALGEQVWMRIFGQWYDLTEAIQELGYGGDMAVWEQAYDMEDVERVVTDLGIDPIEWLGDVTLVGEETLANTAVFHLACAPDLALMMSDAFRLLRSQEFMAMVDPTGDLLEFLEVMESDLPTPAELDEVQAMIPQMFKDLTVDLWAAKSDAIPRQISSHMLVGPPPGEETDGVESIEVTLTISLDNVNQPVYVRAPDSYLPFSALEEMLGGDSGLLPFMGEGAGSSDLFQF
jgi:hypothetical protein